MAMKLSTIRVERIPGMSRLAGVKRWKIARALRWLDEAGATENIRAGYSWYNTHTEFPERALALMGWNPIDRVETHAEVEDYRQVA